MPSTRVPDRESLLVLLLLLQLDNMAQQTEQLTAKATWQRMLQSDQTLLF
jgi:hypothetical protein